MHVYFRNWQYVDYMTTGCFFASTPNYFRVDVWLLDPTTGWFEEGLSDFFDVMFGCDTWLHDYRLIWRVYVDFRNWHYVDYMTTGCFFASPPNCFRGDVWLLDPTTRLQADLKRVFQISSMWCLVVTPDYTTTGCFFASNPNSFRGDVWLLDLTTRLQADLKSACRFSKLTVCWLHDYRLFFRKCPKFFSRCCLAVRSDYATTGWFEEGLPNFFDVMFGCDTWLHDYRLFFCNYPKFFLRWFVSVRSDYTNTSWFEECMLIF